MYITCNKSTVRLNTIVSYGPLTACGELLTELNTESRSFCTAEAIDFQRAISDVMISDECRHTNCN